VSQGPIQKLKRRIKELEAQLAKVTAERDALRRQVVEDWAEDRSISRKFEEDFGDGNGTPVEGH
jgi:DnaJ-domain-containing protein 1